MRAYRGNTFCHEVSQNSNCIWSFRDGETARFGKSLTCELERRSPELLDPHEKLGVAIPSCDSVSGQHGQRSVPRNIWLLSQINLANSGLVRDTACKINLRPLPSTCFLFTYTHVHARKCTHSVYPHVCTHTYTHTCKHTHADTVLLTWYYSTIL